MKPLILAGSLLAAVALSAGHLLAATQDAGAPPQWAPAGLVRIPAGLTLVGQEQKVAEERIRSERNPTNRWVLGGEVGRHSVRVEEFWISPTPVTNEMYLEFVRATGTRPPATWAVIPKELKDRIIEENKQKNPGFVWDESFQGLWWEKNWQDPTFSWAMPPERALEPVVFVTFDEAQSYCAWAGLRLPTEEELVRAARGDGDLDYPFGKEFQREVVAHNTTLPAGLAFKRLPVAMLPNASPYGVYDLVGNVWQWTTSSYTAFDAFPKVGFKVKIKDQITDDKGKTKIVEKLETVMPNWDASRKVIKGGCFAVDPSFCRIDTRLGFDPVYASQMVGFRVVSSGKPAVDGAAMRTRNLRSLVLGGKPEAELAPLQTLGIERRSQPDLAAIEAARKPPEKPLTAPTLPASYRVPGATQVIALIPRRDPFGSADYPETTAIDREARKTRQFPVLAALTTDLALAEPWIPAGNYVLAWMPSFKEEDLLAMGALLPEKDMPKTPIEPDPEKKPGFDLSRVILQPTKEHLLFVNDEGVAVGAVALVDDLKNQLEKVLAHSLTLDMEKDALDFRLRVPGRTGKAYGLRFRVRATDAQGQSLVRAGYWDGEYEVVKLPPGAKPPALPKEPKLPPPVAAAPDAAAAGAGSK